MPGSDEFAGRTPRLFDERGECDACGEDGLLAIADSGRYCSTCIPPEDLNRLMKDVHDA